jgi:large subunit ribosomal protein L10
MAITREQKEKLVEEIVEKIKDSKSLVFADYRGLTVEEMTDVRRQLRAKGVELKVLKQTLFEIAAGKAGAEIDMSVMKDHPVAIAFGKDEVEPAKVIYDFNKKTEKLAMVGGALSGKSISMDELKALATMPSREEMYAKIVGSLASPLRGVVNVLQGNLRGLVSVLNQVAESKK